MQSAAGQSASTTAESVFVRIPALAARYGAINLAQGVFDYGPDPALLDALARVGTGTEHQYSPSAGHSSLRAAVADHVGRYDGVKANPDEEITVTAGATEALHCTIAGLAGRGDEVIVIEPAYEQYAPAVRAAGATVRPLRLTAADECISAESLERSLSQATRAIIVNSPWNPLGRGLSRAEWRALAEAADRRGVVIISDETYEHLNFDGSPQHGVLAAVADPELRVKISSVSKTFAATGWRVGWAVAGPEITRRIRAVHQFVTFCPATPLQLAVAQVLPDPATVDLLTGRALALAGRVRRFAASLTDAGLAVNSVENGFYLLADVGDEAEEWCMRLIKDAGVAALPMTVFYSAPVASMATTVRFAACKRETTLTEAASRIRAYLK